MTTATSRNIAVHAIINTFSGYGQLVCEVIAGLEERGWKVELRPFRVEAMCGSTAAPVPLEILDTVIAKPKAEWELTIAPLDLPYLPSHGKRSIYFSMWEHDRLADWQVKILSMAEAVIVPGEWEKKVFSRHLTCPVYVVPLGINPTIFVPSPVGQKGVCAFGCGGDMASSRKRKNLDVIRRAFQEAFPKVTDAELRVKVMTGQDAEMGDTPNVRVNAEFANWWNLARWLHGLTAFVNVGTEGHGLLVHQAMACGRPVISPYYGGVTEYLTPENSYRVFHRMEWTSIGASTGSYIEVDIDDLTDQMRRVYLDRKEAQIKGMEAARRAHELTWDNTMDKLEAVLNEVMG